MKSGVAGFAAKDAAASKEAEELDAQAQAHKSSYSKDTNENDDVVTTESIVNCLPEKDKSDEKDASSGE